jgi:hypothetical protein
MIKHVDRMGIHMHNKVLLIILVFLAFVSLSENTVLFIFQNTAFRKLDSVSVFR